MAVQYNIPAAESRYTSQVEYFRGVDLNNSPSNVDASRSPSAPNMIREEVGRVRKRTGYRTVVVSEEGDAIEPGTVHGWHDGKINGQEIPGKRLLHIGTNLYAYEITDDGKLKAEKIYTQMADRRSVSFRWGEKLYILDGNDYLEYGYHEDSESPSENGYRIVSFRNESDTAGGTVPTLMISTAPGGAGETYQPVNMLTPWFEQTFLADGEATEYHLCQQGLDDEKPITVQVLGDDGEWSIVENYTADYETGVITFDEAPAASPVSGMDNISVVAAKNNEDNLGRVIGCTVLGIYGVGGKPDRIFIAGNEAYPGYEWYSAFEDPTYFPDTSYNQLARDGASVAGYAVINATLATFLSGSTDGRDCIIRSGGMDEEGEALFTIGNTLIGEQAVAPGSFGYLGTEPMFLTDRGVYAITSSDVTGQKYTQLRSYYITRAIADAKSKESAVATTFRDFYVLSLDGTIYLLDGLQRTYEKNSPYSSYQYECYYFPNIRATALWVDGDKLWYGTENGEIRYFAEDAESPASYNDDGEPIEAWWETTDFDGKVFFRNKTYAFLAVRLATASLTGCKVWAQREGNWSQVLDSRDKARYFDFTYIDFAKFVFSNNRTSRTVGSKIKVKKVDKVRFRVMNTELNEPFGLYSIGMEWKEPPRNYKK